MADYVEALVRRAFCFSASGLLFSTWGYVDMSLWTATNDLQHRLRIRNQRFHNYLQGRDLSFLRRTTPEQLPQQVRQLRNSGDLTLIDRQSIRLPLCAATEALRFLKKKVSRMFQAVIDGLRQ